MSNYFYFINFTKNNIIIYFAFLNLFVLIIIFSLIIFIIATVKLNNQNLTSLWFIYILQFIIPFISSDIFCQIFYTLLTPFFCDENNNSFFDNSYKCFHGIWFDIQAPICIIAIIILFVISYITNLVFYNPMCLRAKNKKIHSLTDVFFFFTKILLNILFLFFRNVNDNYPLLILSIIFTGINVYYLISYQGYSNKNLFFINTFLGIILFWGFVCLFISKIFNSFGFTGTCHLFVTGIVLILIYVYYHTKHNNLLFMIDKEKISSSIEYYKYILNLQTLIEEKDNSRDNKLMLKSFLAKIEENCIQPACFLKKYLNCLSKGIDPVILLFYYMQKLFEDGLNKFNNDLTLTISYIYFLIKRLSKKKKAMILYRSINKNLYSIDKLFNIFRCKKVLETLWTGFDGKDKENIESADVIKIFEYKNNVSQFKDLLDKISLLYYDFWLALFSNNCEGKEEFKTLNDIGSKIHRLLAPIEQSFNNIYCIKNDDVEILKLYTGYIKNILNDENKFEQFHNILSNASTEFIFETSQIDYSSFDINNLHNEKKEVEYFIIGASDKDINERKIINMSIGLSSIIGYQRHEIIGKDFNILIPKIFHNIHNSMMIGLTNKIKCNLYETLSNELKYTPEILKRNVYCKTKTNFLKPLEFKAYLVQTEDGEHIYIVDIVRSSSFPTSWNELGEEPSCCVLTDKNFIIQSFTADCCDTLGLDTNLINSNFEITSCIVQFNEDVLNNLREHHNHKGLNSTFMFENSEILSNNINTNNHINKRGNRASSKNLLNHRISNSFSNNSSSSNKMNNILIQFHNNINNSDKTTENKNRVKRKLVKTKYNYPQIITWRLNDNYLNMNKSEDKNLKKVNNYYTKIQENYMNKFQLIVKECRISNVVTGYYFLFKKIKLLALKNINEQTNYFKKYITNTIEDEQSDYKLKKNEKESSNFSFKDKKLNKSNTEQVNFKSGFYLSKHILNKENKEKNPSNFANTHINTKKINLDLNEEEKKVEFSFIISDSKEDDIDDNEKNNSNLLNDNNKLLKEKENDNHLNNLNISHNFIPTSFNYFDFNLESMSYTPNFTHILKKGDKENESLITNLLTFYQKKLSFLFNNTLSEKNESSTNKFDEESSEENESSGDGYSSYTSNSYNEEKELEENNLKIIKEDIKPKEKKIENKKGTIFEDKENIFNELLSPINIRDKRIAQYQSSSIKANKYSISNFYNEYYKINFGQIRYFYYDFILDTVVEKHDYEKIPLIEKLINEYKQKGGSSFNISNKELKFSNFTHPKENKQKESGFRRHHSKHKNSKIKLMKAKVQNDEENVAKEKNQKILNDNEIDLEKRIRESLNQEDKQKSIFIFFITSLINVLILIAIGIVLNYYIIKQIQIDISIINLICYSTELRTLYNFAVYYLREITLVNFLLPDDIINDRYTSYPAYRGNHTRYMQYLREILNEIYVETHFLTESLTSFDIPFSKGANKFIKENNLTLYVLTNNLELYNINTTFVISLIQINSALNNLAINDLPIQQNTTDAKIFIYNYFNEIGEGIKNQIDIYINELEIKIKNKELILIISMIVILFLFAIVFMLFYISFKSIIKKKSSYIEGFYGIKLSFIKQSIKNCEHFIYFLKKQRKEDKSGLKHEKESELNKEDLEDGEFEEEMRVYNSFPLNRNMNEDYYNYKKSSHTNLSKNNRDSSSMINFSIYIIIYLILIFMFFIYICYSCVKFTGDISAHSKFIFHLQRIQNNVIDYFNIYREFLFDQNCFIYGYNVEEYFTIKLEEIFSTKGNDTYLINLDSYIKQYKDNYLIYINYSLCSRIKYNFFNSEEECENFLQGQIKYGYQVASFTLIDLIRIGFNYVKYYFEVQKNIVGNLTEYGIYDYKNITDNQYFRLYLFNNDSTHSNINVLFAQNLLPFYSEMINISTIFITTAVSNSYSIYIIYMISYISLNAILFLTVGIPFIKNMNSVIYKAKKILGIIPIHILSTLTNIKKILNIEKSKSR